MSELLFTVEMIIFLIFGFFFAFFYLRRATHDYLEFYDHDSLDDAILKNCFDGDEQKMNAFYDRKF